MGIVRSGREWEGQGEEEGGGNGKVKERREGEGMGRSRRGGTGGEREMAKSNLQ